MGLIDIRPEGTSDWMEFNPSVFDTDVEDVSVPDAGRTLDAVMHKNKVAEKQTHKLTFNNPTPEETARISQAFGSTEYFGARYIDPKTNSTVIKTFYAGTRSFPRKIWTVRQKRYGQVSFNIIER